MNIAESAIRYKTFTLVVTVLIVLGGIHYYDELGRLEDPEFTIKEAQVITRYPGATPQEVEEEITDELEEAIQELGQLKEIKSHSIAGLSIITPKIKDKYDKHTLPQVWDELRRKVNDAQSRLPPGAMRSIVNDDFGDVYGVLLAISGKGYDYRELRIISDFLKRELLLVPDVAKVITWGRQQEQIFVEISRARMTQLGVSLQEIYTTLAKQNLVADSGAVRVGNDYIRINPSGEIDSVDEIKELLIRGGEGQRLIYLKDIATVSRGYVTPPTPHMRYDGKPAVALGISTVKGGNVVTMGQAVKEKLKSLKPQIPLGIEIDAIYFQADIVDKSVQGFLINLIEAIVIVIVVLMVFMGLRSGLIIGGVLLITVCSTIVLMYLWEINLQRISLGALIIALGMLVDNAIVVTEGMLIRMQKGEEGIEAAKAVVGQTMWPLFGATVVAVLAFAAIGLSQDSTGEYLRSLFQVMLMSLGMSWVIAITVTPLLCTMFLPQGEKSGAQEEEDPYKGAFYMIYKGFLSLALKLRYLTVGLVVLLLASAIFTFGLLESSFFPNSTSQIFMVHYWLPQGTDIRKTSEDLKVIEKEFREMPGVTAVSTFVGGGAPRYMLVYTPEKDNDAYGIMLVEVDAFEKIDGLTEKISDYLAENFPNANPKLEKVRLGPGGAYRIEARIFGYDPDTLRELSDAAKAIMRADGAATGIREDWRERVKMMRPEFAESAARRAGISRSDLAKSLQQNFTGSQVGIYRERDQLIPIISRAPEHDRDDIENIYDIQVWSEISQSFVPIRQFVLDYDVTWEDAIIKRREKKRMITAQSDPKTGNASVILERIRPKIEALPFPIGYELEWAGEYKDSKDAQAALKANLPATLILMVLVTVGLFNALRQPLIIWLTVPLATIGVAYGLFVTNESFGFMALLGFLSLTGMLIKNAIVLLDEIDAQIASGKDAYQGVLDASVSRFRPVTMAAITTILGMIPLLTDVFFKSMAVTIMSGLAFATLLTLIIVPVFYVIFFRIKSR